jgi:hypothetical protein
MRKSLQMLKQVFLQQLTPMQVIVAEAVMKQVILVKKKKQRIIQVIQIMTNSPMRPLQMSLRQKNLVLMTRTIPMTETQQTTIETTRKMKTKKGTLKNRLVIRIVMARTSYTIALLDT